MVTDLYEETNISKAVEKWRGYIRVYDLPLLTNKGLLCAVPQRGSSDTVVHQCEEGFFHLEGNRQSRHSSEMLILEDGKLFTHIELGVKDDQFWTGRDEVVAFVSLHKLGKNQLLILICDNKERKCKTMLQNIQELNKTVQGPGRSTGMTTITESMFL